MDGWNKPFQTNPFLAANGSSPSPLTIISKNPAEASAGPLPVIYSRNAYARSIPVVTSELQCHFHQISLPAVTPELDQIFLSSVATHRALAIQVMGRSLVSSYKTHWIKGVWVSYSTLTLIILNISLFVVARFPSNSPVLDKIHDPVQTVRMCLAFGPCLFKKFIRLCSALPSPIIPARRKVLRLPEHIFSS